MKTMPRVRSLFGATATMVMLSACISGDFEWSSETLIPVPHIEALSAYSASVGDELQFFGEGFIDEDLGYTEVMFRGVFRHDGIEEPVNLALPLASNDTTTLTWGRFGPYRVPFGRAGNELGVFEGEVVATNFTWDGMQQRQLGIPHQITFNVEPSLVIRDLAAVGEDFESDCAFIGTRLINFVPYRMRVEAVGFEPEAFVYTIGEGLLNGTAASDGATTFEHMAVSSVDSLGVVESIRFAGVPEGTPIYSSSISVEALGSSGEVFDQLILLGVHQPLYVRYLGTMEMAEIMEPRPVSSCMSGGINGADVTYSETTTDTRTISTTHSLTSGWTESYTEQHTSTYGESASDGGSSSTGGSDSSTNRIGFSTTDTENWSWNVHGEVMVGAEGGFGPFASAKAEVRVGGGHDWGGSHSETTSGDYSSTHTSNWNEAVNWNNTVSFSEAVSLAEQHQASISESMSETWTVSSSLSESLNYRSYLLPNTYGLFYRQTTRWILRAEIVALDLCGNESVIGEFVLNDYTWAPDLAMGPECPPTSTLPPAGCLIEPCDESH